MPSHDAIDVGVARQIVATRIQDFIDSPLRPYLPLWMALGGGRVSRRAFVRILAEQVPTGVGKTHAFIAAVAASVKMFRARDDLRKFVVLVPRHELGDAIASALGANDVRATVLRGRQAKTRDPRFPAQEICKDLSAVKAAQEIGQSVQSSCCRNDNHVCPFYDRCGYQARLKEDPDVWIATHEYLSQSPDVFGTVASVFIDEGFWRATIRSFDIHKGRLPNKGLPFGELDGMECSVEPTEHTKRQLVSAIRAHQLGEPAAPDGLVPLTQHLMRANGLSAEACQKVAWTERKNRQHVNLYPGMPAHERSKALQASGRTAAYAANVVRIWEAAADLLEQPVGSRSGRLFLRTTDKTVHVQSGPNVHDGWREFPIMMLDATLPPRAILNFYFPMHQLVEQATGAYTVATPHAHIRQVIKAPVSASKLQTESNRRSLFNYIMKRWVEAGRPKTLVVTQQAAAEWLSEQLPTEIKVRHFNSLSGMNDGEDVGLLVVVGRPLPSARSVELIAGAITGVMPTAAKKAPNGSISYDRPAERIAQMCVQIDRHPDKIAENVRWQICEGEVMQAIGRARAVNRSADNPVQIDIVADLALQIPLDEVLSWDSAKVDREVAMIESGIVLTSPSDMARCWPDAWKDTKAAENWLKSHTLPSLVYNHLQGRGGCVKIQNVRFRYQHAGPRQKHRDGYFDPAIISNPRAWLEQRLGVELAGLEIDTNLAN